MADEGRAERFVRVTRVGPRGFVEFEFSIGDPSLCLDMILPPQAFRVFCRENRVRFLRAPDPEAARAPQENPGVD